MLATSSRILSCGVWLMLMRKISAPASNRRRIIARSDDAGPRVARILIRRSRLMACFRALRLAADQTRPEAQHPAYPAYSEGLEHCRPAPPSLAGPARAAAPAVRWHRSVAQSRPAARRY